MQLRTRCRLNQLTVLLFLSLLVSNGLPVWKTFQVDGKGGPVAAAVPQWNVAGAFPIHVNFGAEEAADPERDWRNAFRLAGTFQTYAFGQTNTVADTRLAMIDLLQNSSQRIVREGDRLEDVLVVSITRNSVMIQKDAEMHTLELSGTLAGANAGTGTPAMEPEETRISRFEDMPALEITPFGKRISTNQWVIQKVAVQDYVDELLDNPLRAAQMVRSMKADRVEGDVAGFRLEMEGEQDFFASMGMQEGDTVRKVNSMKMKSGRRAGYMIQEFMKDRMSAVVLDIERDGKEEKLIYILR